MKKHHPSFIASFVLVVLSSLMVYFIVLAGIMQLPLKEFCQQFVKGYYFPKTNSCTVGKLNGINIHIHLMIFIALFSLLYFLWHRVTAKSGKKPPPPLLPDILPLIGITIYFFMLAVQTVNHTQVFAKEIDLFSNKTLEEKLLFIHKEPYEFAQYCRLQYPGRHKCHFMSDRDHSREPFMGKHRTLAYFLFPDIDIRSAYPDREEDCAVNYHKTNKEQSPPEDYIIKGMFDDNHYLAVKK